MKENQIIIFTDGASRGNPGPGGWGAIVVSDQKVFELGGKEKHTTNNRMEISASIEALAHIEKKASRKDLVIYTDSNYLINGITKWVAGWERSGWKTKTKEDVSNRDLWEKLVSVSQNLSIKWKYLGGHVGIVGNERADEIATAFADGEKIDMFDGPLGQYGKNILNIEQNENSASAKSSARSHSKTKAYSYLSLVEGKFERHLTWAECESRVKGKKAKFRKAVSPEDERAIREEWGIK